jgi:hypothetical protein
VNLFYFCRLCFMISNSSCFPVFCVQCRWPSSGLLHRVVWKEVYRRFRGACCPDDGGSSTSETSVNFYPTTRRNNPEDSHLSTRRRENLKSHFYVHCFLLPVCSPHSTQNLFPKSLLICCMFILSVSVYFLFKRNMYRHF